MPKTADLGWPLARCTISLDVPEEAELVICSPADSDDPASSISISGLANIIALRELINDTIADAQEQQELRMQVIENEA